MFKKTIPPKEPRNIIERQADKFITNQLGYNIDSFRLIKDTIANIRSELYEYHSYAQKAVFLERIRYRIKLGWENHNLNCPHIKSGQKCHNDENYENSLFFVQNEIDEINSNIEPIHLSVQEKETVTQLLNKIVSDLDVLKMSSEFTYNDIINEIEQVKSLYFLDKKSLSQILIGKLTEMIAGGLVSETISKEIIDVINSNYPEIIAALK
jgi:hypothetical protein